MESNLYLKQMEIGPMDNFVYLIGDRAKRECVMVDPAWDIETAIQKAEKDGMRVVAGLLTHTHDDHCNRALSLASAVGGPIYVHEKEAGSLHGGMKGGIVPSRDGFTLMVGDIEIVFIHTPGHTPGSQCFLVQDHVVSGDTLFIDACGRCDLPGGDAVQMYESLQKLARLDDGTVLLPGHNYGPEPVSTIGKEKKHNPYYQAANLQDFLRNRMGY